MVCFHINHLVFIKSLLNIILIHHHLLYIFNHNLSLIYDSYQLQYYNNFLAQKNHLLKFINFINM